MHSAIWHTVLNQAATFPCCSVVEAGSRDAESAGQPKMIAAGAVSCVLYSGVVTFFVFTFLLRVFMYDDDKS